MMVFSSLVVFPMITMTVAFVSDALSSRKRRTDTTEVTPEPMRVLLGIAA